MTLLMTLLSTSPALAHGGFQQSEDVVAFADPGAAPAVVTNFGVLREVGPEDWSWTCEEVTGVAAPFVFEVSGSGSWLLASLNGLMVAPDQCDWQPVEGGPGELYATFVARDVADELGVWATTASSTASNPLWHSADGGATFEAWADFGEGVILRGVLQGGSGWPLWAVGARDGSPIAWLGTEEGAWQELGLEGYDNGQVLPLAVDPADDQSVWLRFNGSGRDALLHLQADGTLEERFVLDDQLDAFVVGADPAHLLLGGRDLGLYESRDGGETWSDRIPSPEVGCLVVEGDWLYICGHNWADGASVLRSPWQGESVAELSWEEYFWFGDVHQVEQCPAGTTTQERCEPLWDEIAPAAGYDQGGDEGDSGDTGDAGVQEPRCGCGKGAAGVLLIPLLLGLGRRR